jgi:H+/Cl- antiporter ClcA
MQVLLASVLAAVVSQAGLGSAPAFRVPDYTLTTPFELPLFVVFGILCGGVSAVSTYSNEVAAHMYSSLYPSLLQISH